MGASSCCRISIEAIRANRTVQDDFSGPLILLRDHLDNVTMFRGRHGCRFSGAAARDEKMNAFIDLPINERRERPFVQ